MWAPRLVLRYGVKVMAGGAALAALGYALLAVQVAAAWPRFDALDVLPGMLAVGLGQGLVMPPLFGLVLSQVSAAQGGLGSGVLITTQQMMLGVGAALLGSLYLSLSGPAAGSRGFVVAVLAVASSMAVIAVLCRFLAPSRR